MESKNLLQLNDEDLKRFLNSFDNILSDCDGVIWVLNKPIEGVKETLQNFRKNGRPVRFVSNNNTEGINNILKKMDGFDYGVNNDDVSLPVMAIIDHLKKIKFNKKLFVFGTSLFKKDLKDAGFQIVDDGPDTFDGDFGDLGAVLEDDPDVGAVVFDVDLNFNILKFQKALVYLKRNDVHYIVGSADRSIPFRSDLIITGPGQFQDLLSELSSKQPLIFGKPSIHFNEYIVDKYDLSNPKRTLFIGDSLHSDMRFATASGYQKLLVLTGVSSLDEMKQTIGTDMEPDYYVKSLPDLGRLINKKYYQTKKA